MSDAQDELAVYKAMQVLSAAVRNDDNYRMEWVQNIATVAIQAGAGVVDALGIAERFVDAVFIKAADEMQQGKRTNQNIAPGEPPVRS
jgi:hypothetical protein